MKTNYKDLLVWQKAFQLGIDIYAVTKKFPPEERFCLVDQMRRSAVSIPSNIAEGAGRQYRKEYIQFLAIAKSSCNELETQLLFSERLSYLPSQESEKLQGQILEILKMLSSLIASLKAKN